MTHICIGKLIIIGSDNGLSPDQRQAIIWTNAGLLSIGPLQTYFSENLIKIQQFSLKKMHANMSSGKWRPFCLGLNVLRNVEHVSTIRNWKIFQYVSHPASTSRSGGSRLGRFAQGSNLALFFKTVQSRPITAFHKSWHDYPVGLSRLL